MNLQEMIRERDELNRRIAKEEAAIRDADFRAAIRRHKITMDQVQLSSIEATGKDFEFNSSFERWCIAHSDKRFHEWNGFVYFDGASCKEHLCDLDTLKKVEAGQ